MGRKEITCKVCGKKVEATIGFIKKQLSLKSDCCSLVCFKKTHEYKQRRKISDELRVRKINEKGGFSYNGKLSKITRSKKFLDSLSISYDGLNDEEIFHLWKKEFEKHSNHSEKIKLGRQQKYPDPELRKKADKERVVKGSCQILGIEYLKDFSEEEKKRITKKAYENFRIKDVDSWKVKHLIKNSNIDLEQISKEKIDILYSEYMSKRFKRSSLESDKNGYLRSQKGWYEMVNQPNDRFFYRSSWERIVFEALDVLVGQRKIICVKNPERVEYEFKGIKRHYYPDAAFVNLAGEILILEIKPKSKITEQINLEKISKAKSLFGDKFCVLTEEDIFENDLLNKLENLS